MTTIPNEVKLFVSKYIGSVQQLRILLMVSSEPSRDWTPEEISKRLNLDVTAVTNRLLSFCVKGLVRANENEIRTFCYCHEGTVNDVMVKKLAAIYKESPAPLSKLVSPQADLIKEQ